MTSALADVPYFDLSDPELDVVSPEILEARERSWYARTDVGIAVLRHLEATELLRDQRLGFGPIDWPRYHGIEDGVLHDWWMLLLNHREGDDHRRIRKLANPMVRPGVVEPLRPGFAKLTEELIDGFVEAGECEFLADFATPYAARVMTRFLGLPDEEWRQLGGWASDVTLAFTPRIGDDRGRIEAALTNLYDRAERLIAERRAAPLENDAVSGLIAAHAAGDLTDAELPAMVVAMIFGSVDTTKNSLALGVSLLIEHPDQWSLLAQRPELAPQAVGEMMRWRPTITWNTRRAKEDILYGGPAIETGETVHIFSYPANTDPRAGGNQPTVDITAERPQHFGFGSGVHHCLGHFLAKLDMAVAVPLLARRLRNPRLNGAVVSMPAAGTTGLVELPIAFDPAERS